MAELAGVGADPSKVKPVHPVEWMDGTYDTMGGHGGAGDAHRVVYVLRYFTHHTKGEALAKFLRAEFHPILTTAIFTLQL